MKQHTEITKEYSPPKLRRNSEGKIIPCAESVEQLQKYEEQIAALSGARSKELGQLLFRQLFPGDNLHTKNIDDINGALCALFSIAPEDAIEGMLAVQIIATHQIGIKMLEKLAKSPDEILKTRANATAKILNISNQQVQAFARYRRNSSSTQTINVNHVTLSDQSQAVIGGSGK